LNYSLLVAEVVAVVLFRVAKVAVVPVEAF
jgi:hypothetical protein